MVRKTRHGVNSASRRWAFALVVPTMEDVVTVQRSGEPRRLTPSLAWCAAFLTYLMAGAALSVVHVPHEAGSCLLFVVAAVVGWWTTAPGAVGVGLLGWPFYSGFVVHAQGQLGVTGWLDAVVAGLLVLVAVGASIASRYLHRPTTVDQTVRRA